MKKILTIISMILVFNATSYATFSDIKVSGEYGKIIDTLVDKEILHGYEDNTFRPSSNITRAEMVKILVTATNATASGDNSFDDVPTNHWAKEYISIAIANGFIKGDGDGNFRPEDNVTYGEVATMLLRAMNLEKEVLNLSQQWPDNFMQYAYKIDLFRLIQTNDLISINPARRDNVAMMTYQMLQYNSSENDTQNVPTAIPPTLTPSNSSPTASPLPVKVDTKSSFTGIITKKYRMNGYDHLVLKDSSGKEIDMKLWDKTTIIPQKNSFIIYQFRNADEIKIKKELALENLLDGFILVTDVDKELIKLEGQNQILDLDIKEYSLDNRVLKLEKFKYVQIIYNTNNNEFISYELIDKSNLKIKKNDKIRFENDLNVCFIIREE